MSVSLLKRRSDNGGRTEVSCSLRSLQIVSGPTRQTIWTHRHEGEANWEYLDIEEEKVPETDLSESDLTTEQESGVRKVLREEADVFARSDDDVGCTPDLEMDIQPTDDVPVQKTYVSIPRPLYKEAKEYLCDLIHRGRIINSSPIVCVRKKDSTLRLCVDFRELNQKAVRNWQPLTKIQDMLDSLGGNQRFSLLDQGKAYHQGFIVEVAVHLLRSSHIGEYMRGWESHSVWATLLQCSRNTWTSVSPTWEMKSAIPTWMTSWFIALHLKDFQPVLHRLKAKGIKIKHRKCEIFRKEVR